MKFQRVLILTGAAIILLLFPFSPRTVMIGGPVGSPAIAGGDGGFDIPFVGGPPVIIKNKPPGGGRRVTTSTKQTRKIARAKRKQARCEARLARRKVYLQRARARLAVLRGRTRLPMNGRQARALFKEIAAERAHIKYLERRVRDARRYLIRCRREVRRAISR